MKEQEQKIKRTLKTVSHVFLSRTSGSLSRDKKEELRPGYQPPLAPIASQQFMPSLKVVGSVCVSSASLSLAMQAVCARSLAQEGQKVCILSADPSLESWEALQAQVSVPALHEVDLSRGFQTFSVSEHVELFVLDKNVLEDFFTFKKLISVDNSFFEKEHTSVLFLIDLSTLDFYVREKIMPLLDSLVCVASPTANDLRAAYKVFKSYTFFYPQLMFQLIFHGGADVERLRMVSHEFALIAQKFLNVNIDYIGRCAVPLLREQAFFNEQGVVDADVFNIDFGYVAKVKKRNWSEELLSLYQTVMSNATV